MKAKIKSLSIILLVFSLFFSIELKAQNECGTEDPPPGSAPYSNNFIGGYYKPERTDLNNGNPSPSWANLNMLFVFIQFPNETTGSSQWPIGQPPTYMDKFLVKDKNAAGPFWSNYKDSSLSDYYQELTRGIFHVNGEVRHLITYNNWSYYQTNGYNVLLTEIYTRLKNDTTINWPKFDQWSRNDANNRYMLTKDKYLDMMGLFFRHVFGNDFIGPAGSAGYVPLGGPEFTVYANGNDTVKINPTRSKFGSGFVVKGNLGPLSIYRAFGIAIHEYGHYLFYGLHSYSGLMTSNGGISVNDLFMSGYEKYKLGYRDVQTVNFDGQSVFVLGEISGRYGTPQLLKVPISNDDFFIIENRRKISQYDVYMLGDTSQVDPFRNTGEYGKGVYITHNNNIGLNYAGPVDIECADGLWNWSTVDSTTPDWSDTQMMAVDLRTSIPSVVNNDNGGPFGINYNSDGVSKCAWFSIGKRHTQINSLPGIDRIHTNSYEYWTSREIWGDRWDAWNVGYNEIFSPYSNPNTKASNHTQSGIYIWYKGYNSTGKTALFEVYKEGANGETQTTILEKTPPSRPMGLIIQEYYPGGSICHPKLMWEHNKEPDMERDQGRDIYKRYRIYRSLAPNMNTVPPDAMAFPENVYSLLDSVDIVDNGIDTASYIDTVRLYDCSNLDGPPYGTPYPVRYRVQAVDNGPDENVRYSVLSDFASDVGLKNDGGVPHGNGGDNPILSNNLIPDVFALKQNYPNPFNPTTNIQFDLPNDVKVSVKVYDVTGKEVAVLVNEFKKAGSYIVSFNGSKLSSGVYFYKIEAGTFSDIKRMVLIK